MSELISLFRKISDEPRVVNREGQALAAKQPQYLVQLLQYLREQKRAQGRALRMAIEALAEAN